MNLALRIARADRTPADRVGNILRGRGLQKLSCGGEPGIQHAEQHAAGQEQAFANLMAAVDIRIVDQALPADRGARLLEIHAHDDEKVVRQLRLDRRRA